jgi:hypothetical protein
VPVAERDVVVPTARNQQFRDRFRFGQNEGVIAASPLSEEALGRDALDLIPARLVSPEHDTFGAQEQCAQSCPLASAEKDQSRSHQHEKHQGSDEDIAPDQAPAEPKTLYRHKKVQEDVRDSLPSPRCPTYGIAMN